MADVEEYMSKAQISILAKISRSAVTQAFRKHNVRPRIVGGREMYLLHQLPESIKLKIAENKAQGRTGNN